uniref:Mitochondrial 2-oxodicarboxylate carrier n=1 Tax=Lates calcarifer TaxID=8187 RepID=A0A4W6C0G2_LATCA
MTTKKPQSILREASHQIIAGGSAGLVEICLMHPLDVVKTRFQIQRGSSDPTSYKSLGDCFRTIFRNEGVFGFYKGILPPILAETPKRAVKFFTFEQYKKALNLTPLSPGVALSAAGLGSGLTEAIVVNPFEVVKVSLQANRDSFKEQPSSFAQARRIIKSDGFGLRGLNKGLTSTLGRHGVFNMIYFGFYFNVKDAIPTNPDPTLEFLRKFAIGMASGTISSCVNIPFDVAKSRIQGPQPVPGEIKYRTCFQTMALVYREEGCVPLFTFTTQQTQPLSQLDEAEAEYTESLLSGSLHLYLFISQLLFHVKVFALVIIVFMARNFLLTQDDGGSVEAKYVFVLLLFFLSSRKIPVFHQGHGHPDRAENKNQFINISG